MTIEADALSRIPLFKGLASSDLEALGGLLHRRQFPPGFRVFSKNDVGASMYVVIAGHVRLFEPPDPDNKAITPLTDLAPGDFIGEMALLDHEPRPASAEALSAVVLGELVRTEFLEYLQCSASATLSILGEMSRRLRWTTDLLGSHAARDIDEELDRRQTFAQKFADRVALWNGSWAFIVLLLGLTGLWIVVNRMTSVPFDIYPYQFFNLLLALLVALQGPLIMMSQNRQAAKDRLRSETDFRVNLKNEVGIEHILRELSKLKLELNQIATAAQQDSLDK